MPAAVVILSLFAGLMISTAVTAVYGGGFWAFILAYWIGGMSVCFLAVGILYVRFRIAGLRMSRASLDESEKPQIHASTDVDNEGLVDQPQLARTS